MRSALQKVAGVKVEEVNYDAKTATVQVPKDLDPSALTKAFEGTQYKAVVAN